MSEMIVVITMVIANENEDEWIHSPWPNNLFKTKTHVVTVDKDYKVKPYNLTKVMDVSSFRDNIGNFKIVVLRGWASGHFVETINYSFKDILPLIAIHAGGNEKSEAKRQLGETVSNLKTAIDKAQFYSMGGGSPLTPAIQQLAEALTKDKGSIEDAYKKLLGELKKNNTHSLLSLFLPLDIDMQALADKKVDKVKYLQDMKKGLDELYKLPEYKDREKEKHYRWKLSEMWRLLKENEDLKNNATLCRLAGLDDSEPEKSPIHVFLESLDTGRKDNKGVEADYLFKPFNFKIEVNIKERELNSFHDWFCALADCLK